MSKIKQKEMLSNDVYDMTHYSKNVIKPCICLYIWLNREAQRTMTVAKLLVVVTVGEERRISLFNSYTSKQEK